MGAALMQLLNRARVTVGVGDTALASRGHHPRDTSELMTAHVQILGCGSVFPHH